LLTREGRQVRDIHNPDATPFEFENLLNACMGSFKWYICLEKEHHRIQTKARPNPTHHDIFDHLKRIDAANLIDLFSPLDRSR
jgi:hypothetical protein